MPTKEMVSTYDILNLAERFGVLNIFIQKGIVPITYLDYKVIYQNFLNHRKSKSKMQSYEDSANECSVSVKTVRIIVKRMES